MITIMKKYCLILLYIAISICCLAQQERHIALGLGYYSHAYISEEYNSSNRNYYEQENYSYDVINDTIICIGTRNELISKPFHFNIHYAWMLGKIAGLGLCLGYDHLSMKQYIQTDKTTKHKSYTDINYYGELNRHIIYLMPEAIIYYLKRDHFSMYGKFGAGLRFNFEKKIKYDEKSRSNKANIEESSLYCQFTPLGLEGGTKNLRGFLDFGYGGQGVVQLGVKYIFKDKSSTEE